MWRFLKSQGDDLASRLTAPVAFHEIFIHLHASSFFFFNGLYFDIGLSDKFLFHTIIFHHFLKFIATDSDITKDCYVR